MKKIKIPPYVRSSNPAVARWQSAVAKVAREDMEREKPELTEIELNSLVKTHPMVLGCNIQVAELHGKARNLTEEMIRPYLPKTAKKLNFHPLVHAYLSQQHFQLALRRLNEPASVEDIISSPIEFPDSDYAYAQWAKCVAIWARYGNPDPGPYIDINAHGGPNSDFGVITIPENCKIVVLGDFGTALNDATTMLIAILEQIQPDILIHLGDIYYSGTEEECQAYVNTFEYAFATAGRKVPVFSIPGNHEYYAGGWGFFSKVITMNQKNGFGDFNQKASFFSLRTKQNSWQLLGMDTGYNSVHNFNVVHPTQLNASYAPWLTFSEAAWHQHKLETFNGKTILLSHHQLFSADSVINDGKGVHYQTGTDKKKGTYLNENLLAVFKPYFSKVAGWFWGHEHTLDIFKENQEGLAKGRLVGNSGYEEWEGEDPYAPTDSPYHDLTPAVELGVESVEWLGDSYNFFNHGFALIQLNGADANVDYFQYPVFSPKRAIPKTIPPIKKVDFRDHPL